MRALQRQVADKKAAADKAVAAAKADCATAVRALNATLHCRDSENPAIPSAMAPSVPWPQAPREAVSRLDRALAGALNPEICLGVAGSGLKLMF